MTPITASEPVVEHGARRAELVAHATELVPLLRELAPQTDELRRLPEEAVAALEEAGMFRLCAPARFGGHSVDIRTLNDVVAEVARGCGSSGWVAFISNMGAWLAGHFPEEAQREVFQHSPDARLIGVAAPTGTASSTEDGVVVNGQWGYASGSLHAHWAALAVALALPDGNMAPGMVLVPMSELTVQDTWYSVGVRGSGSNTVTATDVFVPAHRCIQLARLMSYNSLGDAGLDVAHRQAFAATTVIAVAAPVLGMARAALDMTRERMNSGGKRIAYSTLTDSRESAGMQLQMAEAASLIGISETVVQAWCDRIVEGATELRELSLADRARMRAELGVVMRDCRTAVDLLMSVQGTSGFMESNPVQRVWRDIATATRHGLLAPEIPLEIYGRSLFDDFPELSPFL